MSEATYKPVMRKAYEIYVAYSMLCASALSIGLERIIDTPNHILYGPAILTGIAGLVYARKATKIWQRTVRVLGKKTETITLRELYLDMQMFPGKLLWGEGYDWNQASAQTVFDLENIPHRKRILPPWYYRLYTRLKGVKFLSVDARSENDVKADPAFHAYGEKDTKIVQNIAHASTHTLIVGETGWGKTVLLIYLLAQSALRTGRLMTGKWYQNIPGLRELIGAAIRIKYKLFPIDLTKEERKNAILAIDPKGDVKLKQALQQLAKMTGRTFLSFHPADAENSVRIDFFKNYTRLTELSARLTSLMEKEGGSDNFTEFAGNYANSIAWALSQTYERPNIRKIKRYADAGLDILVTDAMESYLNDTQEGWDQTTEWRVSLESDDNKSKSPLPKRLQAIIRYIKLLPNNQIDSEMHSLINVVEHNRDHASKMLSNLGPVLSSLTAGDLAELLSPSPDNLGDKRPIVDTAKIINSGSILYLGLNQLSDDRAAGYISALAIADIAGVAGDRFTHPQDEWNTVDIVIDEAHSVTTDALINVLNQARAAGFRTTVATQTVADFVHVLGDDAAASRFLANLTNKIIGRVSSDEYNIKYLTEKLPEVGIEIISKRKGLSEKTAAKSIFDYDVSFQQQLARESKPIVSQNIVQKIPDFECISILSGQRIRKLRIPLVSVDA